MTNLLILAGDGRNVGKTYLACKIIKHLALSNEVTGVKITPHFHALDEDKPFIAKNERFVIMEERGITHKDSSLMYQAGATKVYFVMAQQENLAAAFDFIKPQLQNGPVVCESGGLIEIVEPSLFLFVKRSGSIITKTHLLKYHPVTVTNDFQRFDFDERSIEFINNRIVIKE